MCGAHLRELSGAPVVSLAGTPRTILLCCRCAPSPVAPATCPLLERQETQQGEHVRVGWRWGGRRRWNVDLPKPAEAVAAGGGPFHPPRHLVRGRLWKNTPTRGPLGAPPRAPLLRFLILQSTV